MTTCGQTYEGSGYLTADLNCSAALTAVVIDAGKRGTLDLRGFTLTAVGDAVLCGGTCTVKSSVPGGEIVYSGAGAETDVGVFGANVSLIDVRLSGFSIQVWGSTKASLKRVMMDSGGGVVGESRLKIIDSTISGVAGICASVMSGTATIKRSELSGCQLGVRAAQVSMSDTIVRDNIDEGVVLYSGVGKDLRSKLRRAEIRDNGGDGFFVECFSALRTKFSDVTVTGNGLNGLYLYEHPSCASSSGTRATKISRSMFSGNGSDAVCGVSEVCADISTSSEPALKLTACETSYALDSGLPGSSWGLCSLD